MPNIDSQFVMQTFSGVVEAGVHIAYDVTAQNCPYSDNFNNWCVLVVTGVSPATVLAGSELKVAWEAGNGGDQFQSTYFAIWNQYGTLVYLQTIGGWSISEYRHIVNNFGEADVLGLGSGSKATFTSTSGYTETSTDSGTMGSQNWPLWSNTIETSNMCYSSNVYFYGSYTTQNLTPAVDRMFEFRHRCQYE